MKNIIFISIACFSLLFSNCVQKAYEQTVVFKVDVSKIKDIKTVGLRGEEKPLKWRVDKEMTAVVKDSIYTTTVTFLTGYKFTEIKFVVNGEFELNDKPNRRVFFDESKKTSYEAVFDVIKKKALL